MNPRSLILVIIQFAALLYFFFSGSVFASKMWLLAVEIIGIMLGIWAIVAMNPWKVSIFPEPTKVNELIVSGPYRWIRHPMYASILLICLSLAIDRMHRIDFMVFAILLINQLIKLTHEEKLLQAKFPAYTSYMQKSNALIPFLF